VNAVTWHGDTTEVNQFVDGTTGAETVEGNRYEAVNLGEAHRHHKTIVAWGEGLAALEACGITADAPGVVSGARPERAFSSDLIENIGWHRHWDRV
jgi:hypothetical protein